jgi:glycosyltransferase involved in cell wall biosynthesis
VGGNRSRSPGLLVIAVSSNAGSSDAVSSNAVSNIDGSALAIDGSAIPLATGGAGTYVRSLVAHLPATGFAPVMVCGRSTAEPWTGSSRRLLVAPPSRPVRLAWEQLVLPRVLRSLPGLRVVHSPHYTMPRRLGRVRANGGPGTTDIARVVTVHDLTFFTRPEDHQPSKRYFFRDAIRYAARHADAIVAVSDTTAEALQHFAPGRAPVHVIRHGVDHQRFRPASAADDVADKAALATLGIERDYVLHLGTIEPRKNLDNLLRAYEIICAQIKSGDVPALVLAGSAWRGTREPLEAIGRAIEAAHPQAAVRWLGYVDDDVAAPLYRQAAVVAYPSKEEGYGLPVVEALACGAPVVTTAGTVMHELGGDAVLAVDTSEPSLLAAALRDALAGNVASREHRLAVAARYRWDRCATEHAAIYRAVI